MAQSQLRRPDHRDLTRTRMAGRSAIRELIDAYAHCADRRDADGQMSLFTEDAHFVVYMDAKSAQPTQELHLRAALAPVFADLNQYETTTHFNGQNTIFKLTTDSGDGEAYCLAHHVTKTADGRRL